LDTQTTLSRIDDVIAERSILQHPFYQAWQRGELSNAALRDYAAQYYHHVAAFPTYISALHSHTSDLATRQELLENLIDEERGEQNHPSLWLDFAEGVGADRAGVLTSTVQPETGDFIGTFKTICAAGTVAEGLAALYAYESQMPAVSATKMDGLTKYYGITSEKALRYFKVHETADVAHSASERALLARHIEADGVGDVVASAAAVTRGLWGVLTGVCVRHGIAC
jgi:pyrroloquinoline-quinone synthase